MNESQKNLERLIKLSNTDLAKSLRNLDAKVTSTWLFRLLTLGILSWFLLMTVIGQRLWVIAAQTTSSSTEISSAVLPLPTVCVKETNGTLADCATLHIPETPENSTPPDVSTWHYDPSTEEEIHDATVIGGTRLVLLDPTTHQIIYDSVNGGSWHEPPPNSTSTDTKGTVTTK